MEITKEFKKRVLTALFEARENFTGSDNAFAKTLGINNAIFSRIKSGETEQIISDAKWINIGRMLDVKLHDRKWITAKTDVFKKIENDLHSCKNNSTALIMVDECGIGKTYSTRQIVKTLKNSFYVDCSQAKTKQQFIRLLAKTVGVDGAGKYIDVKNDLKYAISFMERPLIVLDEAGDLEYSAFLELKELWNATEGTCGWYMIGADGLRAKIQRGINNKKVGYREIFDRFNNRFMRSVPAGFDAKKEFYAIMISEVLMVNLPQNEHHRINDLVPKILGVKSDKNTLSDSAELGCLRRAETFVNLINQEIKK
jgi:Cdc6-like AAA superfamily ATPase